MNDAPAPEGNGRKYRSKKQRPCDLCRTRKIHCKLQGDGSECELCRRLERQCTFVLGPLRRKYRPRDGKEDEQAAGSGHSRRPSQSQFEARPDFGDVTLGNGNGNEARGAGDVEMDLGNAELWELPADMRQPFGIQDMSSIMGYYGLGSNNAFADANSTSADGNDRFNSMFQDPRANLDIANGFLADGLSPNTTNALRPPSQGTAHTSISSDSPSDMNGLPHQPGFQTASARHPDGFPRRDSMTRRSFDQGQNSQTSSNWPAEFSLEGRRGYSNHLIGLSCESDPFLLRHYKYNAYDNYQMFRLDFRRVINDAQASTNLDVAGSASQSFSPNVPLQFMMSDEAIWQEDLKATERCLSGGGTEAADMALLNKIVEPELGRSLVKLYVQPERERGKIFADHCRYTRFVHPRFPVLSFSDLRRMLEPSSTPRVPIGIQSAVYALAAPFTFLDDELSVSNGYLGVPTDDLWDIAHRSYQRDGCFSHLSLLQLCLLLLHMPPQNFVVAEPSKFWALSCAAVAIAENLGVNIEPKDWRLPREEVMLRRRLWWLTYVGHTWHALVCGRPSHIHDSNWCVSNLSEDDFEQYHDDAVIRETTLQHIPICLAQCELGIIAADVLKEF